MSSTLPSPRTISAAVHHEPSNPNNINTEDGTPDPAASHMMMQFGQFLVHDISMSAREDIDCCDPVIVNQGKIMTSRGPLSENIDCREADSSITEEVFQH